MTCEALFGRMGFECRERSPGVYRVFTPMSFIDGEPIGLYFEDSGDTVRVSDNADTLFHLRSIGLDVSDRKKWRGIDQIVSSFGITLEHSGEVTGVANSSAASGLVSRFIGALLAIVEFEKEVIGITPEVSTYIDEVENHLRLWKPAEKLERDVSVIGHSTRVHKFHFLQGIQLIEAARPHSGRTGSILRKAADVHNSATPFAIMVIMDDRVDAERAKAESDILSTMVQVLQFSKLANNLSGAPLTRQ